MSAAVETFHLTRRFGSLLALEDLSFSVRRGEVFGLLGPNSAGKTVTVRILAGLMRPSDGGYALLGSLRPARDPAVRCRVAYISQTLDFPASMSVSDVLRFCASLYPAWDASLASSLLARFSLPPSRPARELSAGMKLRLAVVCALAQRPAVVLLDEPAGNLDPLARREFLSVLAEAMERDEPAVLFATHQLADLERMVDSFLVLREGRALFSASMEDVRSRCRRVEVFFPQAVPPSFSLSGALAASASGRVYRALVMPFVAEAVQRECASASARFDAFPVSLDEFFCSLLGREGGEA